MFFRKEEIKCVNTKRQQIDRTGIREWDYIKVVSHKKIRERKRSHNNLRLLFAPMNRRSRSFSGKTSFCTFFRRMNYRVKKASLAVETAMVLPLFFLGMVTIISFMDIYKIQTEHLMKLCETVKEAGVAAYVLDGNGKEEIALPDVYCYQPVGGIVPLPKVWMHNTVKVHAWTGKEYEAFADNAEEEVEMVYVTENGEVYHKSPGCSYLNVHVSQVGGKSISSMRNAYGEKYEPCENCSKSQKPGGTVYITKKGNRYHNLASCSGLKRTVRMVKISDMAGMSVCKRCG